MPKTIVDDAYLDERGFHLVCHRVYSRKEIAAVVFALGSVITCLIILL
jgi:hypothetical protein